MENGFRCTSYFSNKYFPILTFPAAASPHGGPRLSRFSMTRIDVSAPETPKTVADHSGRWILLGSIAFILFAAGLLLTLRLLGLK
jgi:hypothetical protein